jgi:hypothetical protein
MLVGREGVWWVPRLPPPEWVDWEEAKSSDEDGAR